MTYVFGWFILHFSCNDPLIVALSVFKSVTSCPGAPGISTGESDSTFRASRPTSWRLEFSSRLVVDMADQVGRLGALCSPASPRPIRNRNPKTSSFLSPATQQQFAAPPPPPAALSPATQQQFAAPPSAALSQAPPLQLPSPSPAQ
jgi:hypothetical protein